MLIILVAISCLASLTAMSLAVLKRSKSNAITIVLSVVGIISGFIALALAAPRDYAQLGVDYLGLIVAVLAVFATLLLGMQLYHVFRMKEDADEVAKAKQQIDEYAEKMEELTKKSEELEAKVKQTEEKAVEVGEKTEELEEEIRMQEESLSAVRDKIKYAVFTDPYDGPDDDK